jgi:CHAD domain-containing protein
MTMESSSLLSRPPEEGARRLALSFLDQAAAAHPRLNDPADTEALHDFRVALRRLRSCLKAYAEPLAGSVPKKLARRLRKLAQATGPGRDTEVQVEWLRGRSKHLRSVHRAGLAWQLARLDERLRDAYSDLLQEVGEEFPGLEAKLRRRLSVYQTEVHLDAGGPHPTFGDITAAILRGQIADLAGHLAQVNDPGDEEEAHRARISAKRLRYLLEPLAEEIPAAAPTVKRLKGLQDLLGELHDAHVLEADLAAAVEEAAAERAHRLFDLALQETPDAALLRTERRRTREPGLLALARLNRERRDKLFAQLRAGWLEERAEPLLPEMETLAGPLSSSEPA